MNDHQIDLVAEAILLWYSSGTFIGDMIVSKDERNMLVKLRKYIENVDMVDVIGKYVKETFPK